METAEVALKECLHTVHDALLEAKPGKNSRDGTTANVCVLHDGRIVTANVGDSRAVLSRGCRAMDLSFDHKPESEVLAPIYDDLDD